MSPKTEKKDSLTHNAIVKSFPLSTKTLISLLKLSIHDADVDTSANAKAEPVTLPDIFHNSSDLEELLTSLGPVSWVA